MRPEILFVHPNASKFIYQDLSKNFSAIEPPVWAMMLTKFIRNKGHSAELLDCEAERLDYEQSLERIKTINPKVVCLVVFGQQPSASTQNMVGAMALMKLIEGETDIIRIYTGPHVSALPERTIKDDENVYVCRGEGAKTIEQFLKVTDYSDYSQLRKVQGLCFKNKETNVIEQSSPPAIFSNLDEELEMLPLELIDIRKYRTANWHGWTNNNNNEPFSSIYTSLGCPFKCVSGDTLVNTVNGKIPIKEISEKYSEIGVYTMDINTKKPVIAKAINILKTGEGQKLVRVKFTDGSHIDCTPDHKFLAFKWGNQNADGSEWVIEAKDLTPKTRLRAMKEYSSEALPYKYISTTRDYNERNCRLVAEFKINRKLSRKEHVHHIDSNKQNDSLNNLQICSGAKEHFSLHPEFSERMKINNPSKFVTEDGRLRGIKKITGLKRSISQKTNYRNSKLGIKNPNYKLGKYTEQSRISSQPENHIVESVFELPGLHDTYCMEVPGYGWFFANDVFIKNCQFCMINSPFNNGDNANNSIRTWKPENIIKKFDTLASLGVRNVKIADEMFVLKKAHFLELCKLIIERKYNFNMWAYARIDTIREEYLEILKKAGVNWLGLGIESANQNVRQEITKGKFKDINIRDIVEKVSQHGIYSTGNYIFGLPTDTHESMRETLALALDLKTEYFNAYCAMGYPGSQLHRDFSKNNPSVLPENAGVGWIGYSQHSYETYNLPTETLTSAEILKFRDEAFVKYFTDEGYLNKMEAKLGPQFKTEVAKMLSVKIKRKSTENL